MHETIDAHTPSILEFLSVQSGRDILRLLTLLYDLVVEVPVIAIQQGPEVA
jgi:hypothetical protein